MLTDIVAWITGNRLSQENDQCSKHCYNKLMQKRIKTLKEEDTGKHGIDTADSSYLW